MTLYMMLQQWDNDKPINLDSGVLICFTILRLSVVEYGVVNELFE